MYEDGELILGLKRIDEDNTIMTLQRTYEYLFDTKLKKSSGSGKKKQKNENDDRGEVIKNLMTCKDIKLFGITFATDVNVGITGAIQINHSNNVLKNTEVYLDDILSPYASGDDKSASTIGNEFRVDKAHYIYNFSINPKEYLKYAEFDLEFTREDYELFKQYSLDSVTRLNTRPKVGCENHFAMFIELKENEYFTPNMRKYLNVIENDNEIVYDLGDLSKVLTDIEDKIDSIEIYYNPRSIQLGNIPSGSDVFDIVTRKGL